MQYTVNPAIPIDERTNTLKIWDKMLKMLNIGCVWQSVSNSSLTEGEGGAGKCIGNP